VFDAHALGGRATFEYKTRVYFARLK
jgi:hypothetical protein